MTLHPGAGYTTALVVLTAFLVARVAKAERRGAWTALAAFLACLALLAISGALRDLQLPAAADALRAVAIYGEGLFIIYLVTVLVFRAVLPVVRISTPRIIHDVVIVAAALAWAGIWLRQNHVNLTSIVATSAVVTAVVAFSLQDTLGNILGGVAIQLDQSVQVGDWIEADGIVGRVAEIRWRYTSLETRDWETVVVPNSRLVKDRFRVLGRRTGEPPRLRRTVYFNVDFRFPPADVVAAVQTAVRETKIPRVATYPEPVCLMMDFSDSAARFAVRYWLEEFAQDDAVDSEVRQVIYFSLQRAGIPPCIPAQHVFFTEESEARRQSKQERSRRQQVAALRQIDVFASLQHEELELLARRLHHSPFARGALMTRQGAEADWLYLLVDGRAEVIAEGPDGSSAHVAELGPGSFFGEMGLMTGEPRAATVIARTPVDAYRLDKAAFREILHSRPEIAEEISHLLARRKVELESVRENLDSRVSETQHALLDRIQAFFGLETRPKRRRPSSGGRAET